MWFDIAVAHLKPRSTTPRVCRNVVRLGSVRTPVTEDVILAAVEGDTGEIHDILHEYFEYCNQGPGCRPTSWRPVGYVITTFGGKCRCFQEVRLYFSRVTARLGCFHYLVSDVILQWRVSRKLNMCGTAGPLKTGRIDCPGTSVNNYQLTLRNNGNIVVTIVNCGIRRLFLGLGKFYIIE
jgi:hypothetical protein